MKEEDVSLVESRKETCLQNNCNTFGVQYEHPLQNETVDQKELRRKRLRDAVDKKRKQQKRECLSQERREEIRVADTTAHRQQRSSLSPERREEIRVADTTAHRQRRSILSPERREEERVANTIAHRQQRSNLSSALSENDSNEDRCILKPPDKKLVESLVKKAIKEATRTQRADGNHQATVCVVCDQVIIGDEKVCMITKDKLKQNHHRISVEAYQNFYGTELHPLLIQQYMVENLQGLLLSPRAYRDGDKFECCASCYSSMNKRLNGKKFKPPKNAIANGFVIGHLPSELMITGEDAPRQLELDESKISELMSAALSTQRSHGFVFAFMGGAHKSLVGQFSFFEMDQNHLGSVINQYRSTGANDHLLCVLCGRFTPAQRIIAREKASLNTKLYVDLMTWFIRESNHPAYKDLTPPEQCPAPRILEDEENDNNTDISQDPDVENQYQGGTFTFTSSNDPTENSGVFPNSAEFASALMNQSSPLLLVRGGGYVNASKELKLENVFPIQFPFGLGGPKQKRPTRISQQACLQHYAHLSLPQFMRGDFLLVVLHMMNRMRSFQSGLITCRSLGLNGHQSFAESISTLTDEQIKAAAENITKNIEDNSVAAQFLRRAETSCRSIGYTAASVAANRRLNYALCDRFGIPHIFFTISPDDECSFKVQLWANAGRTITMPSLDCDENICLLDYRMRRDTRLKYPGACALEYESIMKTLLRTLFGWNCKKRKGTKGIFGTLLAFSLGHEEQGEF